MTLLLLGSWIFLQCFTWVPRDLHEQLSLSLDYHAIEIWNSKAILLPYILNVRVSPAVGRTCVLKFRCISQVRVSDWQLQVLVEQRRNCSFRFVALISFRDLFITICLTLFFLRVYLPSRLCVERRCSTFSLDGISTIAIYFRLIHLFVRQSVMTVNTTYHILTILIYWFSEYLISVVRVFSFGSEVVSYR